MQLVLLVALLAQPSGCTADAVLALADAGQRVRAFDLAGAVTRLENTSRDCETTRLAFLYLHGLQAAREAYRDGGDDVSLAPVTADITELEQREADGANPRAQLLRVTLMAAAAAAQSERDDMLLLLQQATSREKILVSAGMAAAPAITAHEVAGDLWLQVHRFDAARAAYLEAARIFGPSLRISLGLARVAVRLRDDQAACSSYRTFMMQWPGSSVPPELVEARAFAASPRCSALDAVAR